MEKETVDESIFTRKKVLQILSLIVIMILLAAVAGPWLTNQKTYETETRYLDEKMKNANMLALGSSSASFLIFSICIASIIPLGCRCGQAIEDANRSSIDQALRDAVNANEIVDSMPAEEDKNFFQKIGDFFAGIWDSAKQAYEWAKSVLNNFMASIAVMMVTTIVIPFLIFFSFLWAIKFLTKRDFVISVVGFADRFTEETKKKLTRKKGSV